MAVARTDIAEPGGVAAARAPNTHDKTRAAIARNAIGRDEILVEMERQKLCRGREAEMVDQLLAGGPCVMGVAMAVFTLIGRQMFATRHRRP